MAHHGGEGASSVSSSSQTQWRRTLNWVGSHPSCPAVSCFVSRQGPGLPRTTGGHVHTFRTSPRSTTGSDGAPANTAQLRLHDALGRWWCSRGILDPVVHALNDERSRVQRAAEEHLYAGYHRRRSVHRFLPPHASLPGFVLTTDLTPLRHILHTAHLGPDRLLREACPLGPRRVRLTTHPMYHPPVLEPGFRGCQARRLL
jgi:hypothetical protein